MHSTKRWLRNSNQLERRRRCAPCVTCGVAHSHTVSGQLYTSSRPCLELRWLPQILVGSYLGWLGAGPDSITLIKGVSSPNPVSFYEPTQHTTAHIQLTTQTNNTCGDCPAGSGQAVGDIFESCEAVPHHLTVAWHSCTAGSSMRPPSRAWACAWVQPMLLRQPRPPPPPRHRPGLVR